MQRPALIIHCGAGPRASSAEAERQAGCAAALATGWAILSAKGSAVDAVAAAVIALEDCPLFNAGVGSCLTRDGTVEMDASIMDGRSRAAGAVASISTVLNPVRLARAVMEDGRHVLVVGAGAERFAHTRGVAQASPARFITPAQRERWKSTTPRESGTVGAAALDVDGHVAAATSTGGMMHKLPGRVGDSAIIGAGTYADDGGGAASATGKGESIIVTGLTKSAVDRLRAGIHPATVANAVITDLARSLATAAGIVIVDRFGRIGHACNTPSMLIGWQSGSGAPTVADVGQQ